MARLKKNIYPALSIEEVKDPIILAVDMINGFIYEGALHDEHIAAIIQPQQRLMEALECRNVFICDAHPPRTREFDSFPKHCLIGTSEADVVADLQSYMKYLIHKNSTNAFVSDEFQTFLKEEMKYYQDILIVGCCTDLCVLQLALSLQGWLNEHNKIENRIIIPVNCVETYHNESHDAYIWNDFALQNMEMNGIQIVSKIQ